MDVQERPRHKHRIPYWSRDTGQLSASVGTPGQVSQGGLGSYLRETWGAATGKSGEVSRETLGSYPSTRLMRWGFGDSSFLKRHHSNDITLSRAGFVL